MRIDYFLFSKIQRGLFPCKSRRLLVVILGSFTLMVLSAGSAWGQQADLESQINDGQSVMVPGNSIAYSIEVVNRGPDPVTSVTLTPTLPADLESPTFTSSFGDFDSGTGLWDNFCLDVGGIATLTLNGTVATNVGQTLTTSVSVSPPAGTVDPNSANDSASDTDFRLDVFGDGFESGDTSAWTASLP